MAFRLEEHLPVSAEEFVADYIESSDGQALGVAARVDALRPMVDALESLGVPVRHIIPTALLAAGRVLANHGDASAVLIVNAAADDRSAEDWSADFIECDSGRPRRWSWVAGDRGALAELLQQWRNRAGAEARVVCVGPAANVIDCDAMLRAEEASPADAAALEASAVLGGVRAAVPDLRVDALAVPGAAALHAGPVGPLAAAAAFLLVSIIAVTQWRLGSHEAATAALMQEQVAAFKEALPGQRVPSSIKGRLISEERKLAGLGGVADGREAAMHQADSALVHLHRVVSSAGNDVRWRLLELSIQPDTIRIDGEARTHADAERIAGRLGQSGHYAVDPPRTQALREQGVSFVFTARPAAAATAQGGSK